MLTYGFYKLVCDKAVAKYETSSNSSNVSTMIAPHVPKIYLNYLKLPAILAVWPAVAF